MIDKRARATPTNEYKMKQNEREKVCESESKSEKMNEMKERKSERKI